MKLARPTPCRSCGEQVAICLLRNGTWVPFNLAMVAADDAVPDAYLPMPAGGKVMFVPVADVAPRHLADVRWYATRHRCAPYMRAAAEARQKKIDAQMDAGSIGNALNEHWGGPGKGAR